MSDSSVAAAGGNGDGDSPPIDKQVRLAAMIAKRAVSGEVNEPVTVQSRSRGMSFNTRTNLATFYDERSNVSRVVNADDVPGPSLEDGQPVHDDGRSIHATRKALQEKWEDFERRFEEHTFDPRTGEKRFRLDPDARAQLHREWTAFDSSMKDELVVLNKLQFQREATKVMRNAAFAHELEREAQIDRRALEIADETEARRRAEAILERRR